MDHCNFILKGAMELAATSFDREVRERVDLFRSQINSL